MNRAMQVTILLYSFWMIPLSLNFMCRRFEHSKFHFPSMEMERKECSDTSAHKIQTLWYNPKEKIQHSDQGECLKSRTTLLLLLLLLLLQIRVNDIKFGNHSNRENKEKCREGGHSSSIIRL